MNDLKEIAEERTIEDLYNEILDLKKTIYVLLLCVLFVVFMVFLFVLFL